MPLIPVGTRVTINPSSCYYHRNSYSNPANMGGEVLSNGRRTSHNYFVRWDNNAENSYREEDLLVVGEGKNGGKTSFRIWIKKKAPLSKQGVVA